MVLRNFLRFIFTLLIFLVPLPLYGGVWNSLTDWFSSSNEINRPPTIRVLVANDLEEAFVEVKGRYALYDPYTNKRVSSRFLGKARVMEPLPSGLKWGEEFPGIYQLKIKPLDRNALIVVNGKEYKGTLTIYDTGGTISLVNEVDLEEFLLSTFRCDQERVVSPEALAALAISARTNAFYYVLHPKNTYWAIDAEHAGYRGVAKDRDPLLEEALRSTRHMIMSISEPREGFSTPFPVAWGPVQTLRKVSVPSLPEPRISLRQAEDMAERGDHAARILSKAFPGSSLMVVYKGE